MFWLLHQIRKAHTNLELERSELEDQQKRIAHKETRIKGALLEGVHAHCCIS